MHSPCRPISLKPNPKSSILVTDALRCGLLLTTSTTRGFGLDPSLQASFHTVTPVLVLQGEPVPLITGPEDSRDNHLNLRISLILPPPVEAHTLPWPSWSPLLLTVPRPYPPSF